MARGSIRERRPGSWALTFDLGSFTDPITGKRRRKQQTLTFRGTREDAEKRLRKAMGQHDDDAFVAPSKTPLIDYLRAWLVTAAPVGAWRPATVRLYKNVVEKHIATHSIAFRPLQKIRGSHIEGYLASRTGAPESVRVHRAVLHRALRRAVKDGLLLTNPAGDLDGMRRKADRTVGARQHCWSPEEARRFLAAAVTKGAQISAYMHLAIDSGARRSELDGLGWQHVDLERATVTFERQLDTAGVSPTFGPTKTQRIRTIPLNPETIAALRIHRQQQAELKMRNRLHYVDFELVFAKEDIDMQRPLAALGQPISTLGGSKFHAVVKAAGIRRIKFHGVRHTCASLLLAAGEPAHVVAARLGHSTPVMTLSVYAHSLPSMQRQATSTLGSVLFGGRGRA